MSTTPKPVSDTATTKRPATPVGAPRGDPGTLGGLHMPAHPVGGSLGEYVAAMASRIRYGESGVLPVLGGLVILVIIFGLPHVHLANLHPFIPPNTGTFGHFGVSGILAASGMREVERTDENVRNHGISRV